MKSFLCFQKIILVAGLTLLAASAQAQFLFQNISGQSPSIIGTNLTAGAAFTVGNQPLLVTALGVYDDLSDGLNQSYSVGIWGVSGLLTSTIVPAGSGATLQGDFRYVSVTPLVLSANTTYRIGANLGFNNAIPFDLLGFDGTATLDPAFSFANANRFSGYNTGFADPTQNFSYNLWAANLQYTTVPEPGAASLLAIGLLVRLALRKKSAVGA